MPALLNVGEFPFVLPIWRPPPSTDSPRWRYLNIHLCDGQVDSHDLLAAIALALRIEGTPRSATFDISLPDGPVPVAFPSSNDPDLICWRPEQVHPMREARVTVRLNHSLTPEELKELAMSMSAPLLVSQSSIAGSSHIQATYDWTAVTDSGVGWFLIHVARALRSFRAHSRSLIVESLLVGAIRRHFFHGSVFARLIPPWILFRFLGTLKRSGAQRSHRKISDISPIDCAEKIMFGGNLEPRARSVPMDIPPTGSLLHEVFLGRARSNPLSIAFRSRYIAKDGKTPIEITYAACHAIALQLAKKLDIFEQSVVPIALLDPVDMAISMIAVLLAGATYVIMDPRALDDDSLQQCLRLGQSQSHVTLAHQTFHSRFKVSNYSLVDPSQIIQNLLQDDSVRWVCGTPPYIVGENIAFISSPSKRFWDPSVITNITHTLASDLVRASFSSFDITHASKVLVMENCPGSLLHAVIWNTFAHGGTIFSVANLDSHEASIWEALGALQYTHVVLPVGQLNHVSAVLVPSVQTRVLKADDESTTILPTLIIPEDSGVPSPELVLHERQKIIKYIDCNVVLEERPLVLNMDIDVVFCSENDGTITPADVLTLLPTASLKHKLERSIVKLRDGLVVKYGGGVTTCEAHSMIFVRKHTKIRVPFVHLVFRRNRCTYIVMQYIDAPNLEQQWNDLDENTRATSISQFAKALQQLRALENPTLRPGPVEKTACCGPWFTIYNAGPFETHADLVQWLNHKIDATTTNAETLTANHRLVFTHQDLALRNLILDKENQLWIIDWELAGWYPAYFEYACVASMSPIPKEWASQVLPHLGQYGREYRSLQALERGLEFTPFA